MALKNNELKRARATNFSFNEKELLLKYALENQNILENKESNAVSWKDKNKCWLKIAEQYNSATLGCVSYMYYVFYTEKNLIEDKNLSL